jgi:5'-nucleotidase
MIMSRAMWAACAAVGVLLAGACGKRDQGDELGTMALAVMGDPDTAGFQFDVATSDGTLVANRYVANPTSGKLPADAFFTLEVGNYVASATPMSAMGVPQPGCAVARAPAAVTKGKTTELVLVARCQARGRGGLDVAGRTNFEPEITNFSYEPSKYVTPCQKVSISVDAEDRDGDPLTYAFALVAAPANVAGNVVFETAGKRFSLTSSVPGDFQVEARACDPSGCAQFVLPLHVLGASDGSCSLSCDDANPCTTDERAGSGACVHTPAPSGPLCTDGKLRVKLLGFNDFHGQLEEGRKVSNRPVGGAAVLAAYLEAAQAGIEDQTLIVHAGDQVGASPPASALLQDEPAISFLNLLANPSCSFADRLNPACNLVGTLGNHEFDEGRAELIRLLMGGNYPKGPFLEDPYRGARFPYVSANVVDAVTGQPILPPYVVKRVRGVPVAFIGAVLKDTPTIVTPTGVAGLKFLDEADAINSYVPELKAMGVHAIVVTIHQGGTQTSYTGPTKATATLNGAPILDILKRLDDEIDVVVSGHSHAFTNALVPNAHGVSMLVTQAFSASTAYADIDLLIDPVTGQVASKTAKIVTTFADVAPGQTRDPAVGAIVAAAQLSVGPLVSRVVGTATTAFTQTQNAAGESSLGDLIADAQRAALGTDFAFMNPGGIRANLDAGPVTWGALFTIQPFGNSLVKMSLTGEQVYQVLEQQWAGQPFPRIMQISGFEYTWDPARPAGSRVLEARQGGVALDRAARYSITCNNFMAAGGDNFTTFVAGLNPVGGPIDLDALVDYVEARSPLSGGIDGRIRQP